MPHATLDQVLDMQHAAQPVCMLITSKSNDVLQTSQSPLLGVPAGPVLNPMLVCLACSAVVMVIIIQSSPPPQLLYDLVVHALQTNMSLSCSLCAG